MVIALIGVGNTLALSVIEGRHENGLMRALGLTRGQLCGLLASRRRLSTRRLRVRNHSRSRRRSRDRPAG